MVFRRPLHEIALWPAAELQLIRAYLAKRPAAEDRIEALIATGHAMWVNSKQARGTEPTRPADFLPFLDPWAAQITAQASRYSETDQSLLRALGAKVH